MKSWRTSRTTNCLERKETRREESPDYCTRCVGDGNVLALQNAQDTNKLLVAVLEQQTILAKHLRDAEASAANADIERRLNSFNFNQQLTAGIGANLNGYRLP